MYLSEVDREARRTATGNWNKGDLDAVEVDFGATEQCRAWLSEHICKSSPSERRT